jgi:hypothetical protein
MANIADCLLVSYNSLLNFWKVCLHLGTKLSCTGCDCVTVRIKKSNRMPHCLLLPPLLIQRKLASAKDHESDQPGQHNK